MSNDTHKPDAVSRRQFLQLTGATFSAAAFLAACGVPIEPGAGTGADAGGSEAMGGGTLGLMGHQEVAGLSPENWGPSVQTTMIRAIHDSLMLLDENLENQLVLADSLDIAEDGLTYTYGLKQGVKFHDGTELTAKDVVYTFDYFRNPDNASSIINNFRNVESVEAPDDYTIVISMNAINAAFLTQGAQCPIVQSAYHAEVGDDAYQQAPIGTGPFKLVEFNPSS